jgi:hypothetical protein
MYYSREKEKFAFGKVDFCGIFYWNWYKNQTHIYIITNRMMSLHHIDDRNG